MSEYYLISQILRSWHVHTEGLTRLASPSLGTLGSTQGRTRRRMCIAKLRDVLGPPDRLI